MSQPPFPAPNKIQISGPPGVFSSGDGGWLSTFTGPVTVRIDGDPNFSVVSLETLALQISHDPGLPPGPHPRSWQTVSSVDGPGPIAVRKGEALVITVGFGPPVGSTQVEFDAFAVVVENGVKLASLPIVGLNVDGPAIVGTTVGHIDASGALVFGPGVIQAPGGIAGGEPTSMQFVALANLSDGGISEINPTSVTWISSNSKTASIGPTGLAHAVSAGPPVTITAVASGFPGQAMLDVD